MKDNAEKTRRPCWGAASAQVHVIEPRWGATCCAPTGKNYDFEGGSFCLGVILASAASMSGGRAVTGAFVEAPAPPLLGPPKKRMAVAARPSSAPPPLPPPGSGTSGTDFALPSARAET